jgi:NTP pyrophosphatase (non-canonical NTP hydrolase)
VWTTKKKGINQMSKVSSIVGKEYFKAKDKHPVFPDNPAEALGIITEELGELAQAINDGESKDRQIEEAAHVAVTAIRFIEQAAK